MRSICRLILVPPAVAAALLLLTAPGCTPGAPSGSDGGTASAFNNLPIALATADVVRGIVPLTVHFDSSRSEDMGGYIASRLWDFGDGETATEISPEHVFLTSGEFTVTLTVTDNENASSSESIVISATEAPVPILEVDHLTAEFAPAAFAFDGSNSYDSDGSIASYLWDFGDGAQESLAQVNHIFSRPGNFRVRLTVTDDVGIKAIAERVIVVGISKPEISFRVPAANVANIALAREAPLWVAATYNVEPGVPYMLSAGLDRDTDACDAQALVYDRATGELLNHLLGAQDRVRTAAFSPDGVLILLAGDDGFIRMYDVDSGSLLVSIDSGAPAVTSLAFSPDSTRYIYGGTDGSLVLRDTYTGQVLRTFAGHPGFPVNSVAFSPAGRLAASGSDDATAAIWDTMTGNFVRLNAAVGGHTAAVNAVAFSPINLDYFATGSADRTAKVWRLSRLAPLLTCAGHTNEVTSVAFSPDGLLFATGSLDGTAALWNIGSGASTPTFTFTGFEAGVTSLAFSPDHKQLLAGCSNGLARIFDVATKVELQSLQPCSSTISSASYDKHGETILLAVAAQNEIRLDTLNPGGGDLNLSVPAGLDVSTLTDEEVPGQYYLWVALDTDRTDPVRTYAAATVQMLNSATEEISPDTPIVPLVSNAAVVVPAPTPGRQIFDLGPLHAGDRLELSLAAIPGYTPVYESDVFSVLVLDAAGEMFAWYQNPSPVWNSNSGLQSLPGWSDGRTPLSASDVLIVGHDSPSYYLVLDGCTRQVCGDEFLTSGVAVNLVPALGLAPQQQRVWLNFDTALQGVTVSGTRVDISAFDIAALNPAWGAAEQDIILTGVQSRLAALFNGYDVLMNTDRTALAPPYLMVSFGGGDADYWISWVDYLDPRNQTRSGAAYVFTNSIAADFPSLTAAQMGTAFANIAAQQIGLLVGLRNSELGSGDIMDPNLVADENHIASPLPHFATTPLNGSEQLNGPFGMQNAPQLLSEVVGTH